MTAIKSIPQSPREDDPNAVTSRMNISFLLTAANAAEAVDKKEKCWSESTSQHPPTTGLHECDELKWQPTPPNSSQSSPSSNFRLDVNINLPPIRLSPPESQQEERQLPAFPQQQEVQLHIFRTIETSNLHDLEQNRQRQLQELITHWNSKTFSNPRIPFTQNGSQLAHLSTQVQQQQQQHDTRLRADQLTHEYHSQPTQQVHRSIPMSRSTRSPRPGRRHPRASRHRHLTPSQTTPWDLPIPIHTSHPRPNFESLSRPYAHPDLQAPLIHAQDATTHYDSQDSPSVSLARGNAPALAPAPSDANTPHPPPHSNKAYPLEQVDWIRYQKDDCGVSWSEMLKMFHLRFPENRLSDQCLSSRYYRDNRVPLVEWTDALGAIYTSSSPSSSSPFCDSGDGELLAAQKADGVRGREERFPRLMRDEKGRIKWMAAKVRDRASEEGKELGIPFHLVDKHPERAVAYAWVREEHKVLARGVLERRDTGDVLWAKKAEWRHILRMVEQEEQQSGGAGEGLTLGNMHMRIEMQQ